MQSKQTRAMLLMTVCAALWSLAGFLIKSIPWHAFAIAGIRSLIASFVVLGYMHFTRRRIIINRRTLLSAVFVAGTFLSFVTANKLTTSANAIVLQFTAPVYIALYQIVFRRQRIKPLDLITVALTLIGIALFFLDQLAPGYLVGNLVALFAGVMLAAMYVATGEASENECMSGIYLGHLLTALIGIPFAFLTSTPFTSAALINILLLGIFQLGIPYVLYGMAVRHVTPLACSLLAALEPLLNPLLVFLLNGEKPGPFALIGGTFVIGVITTWCILSARGTEKDATVGASGGPLS